MKNRYAAVAGALVCSAVSVFAGNNHGSSGGNFVGAGHRASSSAPAPAAPTTVGPRFSGISRSGNGMPYRARALPFKPTVTYRNGQRTLNYPAVGVSNVQRSANSNYLRNTSARTSRPSNGNLQATNAGNLQRNLTGVRTSGNSQHAGATNISRRTRLDPQASARLRNWSGNPSSTNQAHQNHWNNCHHHHNHNWWHNRCAALIFWDWGWWGWYDGWWYPAWGYDPYSYYAYNEPIYGYGDLPPEQIIAGVQVALQEQGYYNYAIDGQMGPQTRAAIGQYQADHRLPVTYGIDQPTLGALGIIH
jgi:hypothetical protein